ncbi:molybdate transport system ATP-binding protein [Nocardioides thalensis]|uniref:Molybdate transport system ATP-binding protein n=1 Tax=Nocardioides thalensis TaxID=1914755 RepID=A0A853C7R1_9ACTN|nr:ABC transporter ATP-binding protein [Nocardioides thalensis]NYJ02702.1 molybdate transport system ATP-binding protein [Nocardioides thalensis]
MRLEAHVVVPGRLDAEITADPGDVVAVVGPNGAGKSTLVHALAGLVPASGHARLGGRDLLPLPPQQRGVGVVFQDRRLFPHLTSVDNVAFGLRARSRDGRKRPPRPAEARAEAQRTLDRLGVGHLGDRKPRKLSGGQAQRVAIARALVTDPDLLLLDEPFTGLDVGVAAELRIELAQHLAAFRGVTLLVTHDALDALTLATRVVVLDEGRVVQSGPPDEVAARPLTEHVARLVGLNVVRHGDELRAFPPAAVTVSRHRPDGSARNTWSGTVRSAAPHGDAVRLQVATESQTLLADVTPAATRELALTPGQEVWLAVKETAVTRYPTVER